MATQDTITQLVVAIRRVRREAPEAAEIVAAMCHAQDYDDAGKRAIAWDDHQACGAVVSAVVGDATTIVHALRQATLNEILSAFVHVHLSIHKARFMYVCKLYSLSSYSKG